jgi:Uma2 family endonuclease
MSTTLQPSPKTAIIYPESDGQPMAENTLQFQWIVTIEGGLDAQFRDDPNVFVAGDLFWYPVEGDPTICMAPDILVAFGRPKGHRGSYLQWVEGNIAPQVVFEILSPGNRSGEMSRKFQFYEKYGVDEYYVYDPDNGDLSGWIRSGDRLQEIPQMHGWVSPRLNVRFELVNKELVLYGPDGRKFLTYLELAAQRDQVQQRADRLAAQLRALGIEPEA